MIQYVCENHNESGPKRNFVLEVVPRQRAMNSISCTVYILCIIYFLRAKIANCAFAPVACQLLYRTLCEYVKITMSLVPKETFAMAAP